MFRPEAEMLRDSGDIIRRLKQDGFRLVSITGSHHKFRHPVSNKTTIVTHPRRDIALGTVRAIYKQIGWKKD
jgi:predicted RNA binding protein YcfA (HicA-like mRNA interferase family)